MAGPCFRFTFPPIVVTEPIIYELGRQFAVTTNIRRANVTKDSGWVILELQGEEDEVARAVAWARGRGVVVEAVGEECLDATGPASQSAGE